MEGSSAFFLLLLMGQMAECVDFRTSADVLNIPSESTNFNMTCSPTERNIHTILFIKLHSKSSFGSSSGQLTSKVIAVITPSGISTGTDVPTTIQGAVVSGHINKTYTSDSRLQVNYNFTRVPCGIYSIVFSCEISYLASNSLHTLTHEANETLTVNYACNSATTRGFDEGMLSGSGFVQHWILFMVVLTALNLLL